MPCLGKDAIRIALALLGFAWLCVPAHAEEPTPPNAGTEANPAPASASGTAQKGFWGRDTLLDDAGGARSRLALYGVTATLQETGEVFGNTTGGVHTGAEYEGLTQITLAFDAGKAFGWQNGRFNLSALQLHGRSVSLDHLASLQQSSSIEGHRGTRLWELWYQQDFPGEKLSLRLGEQSLDQEFIVSRCASLFINTLFGWPIVPSVDLPGVAAYPLATLGARVKAQPTDQVTLLAGVFDDSASGHNVPDPQAADRHGLDFRLGDAPLLIAEAQYALPQTAGLPGTYKIGAWYDFGHFPDPRGAAIPGSYHGNYAVYALMDQAIWKPKADGARELGVFASIIAAPGDRNLVERSAYAGLVLKAPFANCNKDALGIGIGYAGLSSSAVPSRTSETFVEATYQYRAAPWWLVQPDLQYGIRPGGGIPDPNRSGQRIGNEFIVGLRSVLTF